MPQYHFEMTVEQELMVTLVQLLHDRGVLFKMVPVIDDRPPKKKDVHHHRDDTSTEQIVIARLRQGPATNRELRKLVGQSGRSPNSLSPAISKLKKEERVHRDQGGLWKLR